MIVVMNPEYCSVLNVVLNNEHEAPTDEKMKIKNENLYHKEQDKLKNSQIKNKFLMMICKVLFVFV